MANLAVFDPRHNQILAALPGRDYTRLEHDLERVALVPGALLHAAGDPLKFVYFPTTAIIALILANDSGASAELAMIGRDGLVGIPLVLGGVNTRFAIMVQSGGEACRLSAELMCRERDEGGNLQRLSLRYAQALMTQMAYSIVCNRHHLVDRQLCRWLLSSLDLLPGNQVDVTQEMIARMLGVRREAVTEAAGKLQSAGLIQYRRGHITVNDRAGLEARACECYRAVREEYEHLFGAQAASKCSSINCTLETPRNSLIPSR
ncbi:MAG TPA: Crp/Fnr family transcriptional regulator [Rhodocyclaceae bacterium]|nr:Crp/Fnr family transcriptional regulator [Rhodocyclaceae bacterium]